VEAESGVQDTIGAGVKDTEQGEEAIVGVVEKAPI
jgi:hypothetical protein